jgi:dihydrodiol dehydrogenase / D-xylose 1-dehydrogenase (NADP)
MEGQVGWAILGTGTIAQSFAEDLRTVADAKLVAVGSRDAGRAASFAARFGAHRSYDSYEGAVRDSAVHAVYVATPHSRHIHDAVLVLEANKALLCEKPFMLNSEEAQTVVGLARKRQQFCMEAMWTRFLPPITETKQRVLAGEIGELVSITADFGYPSPRGPNNRLFDPSLGGGAMLDRGVYGVSLAVWFFGPPDIVKATAAISEGSVDEHSQALLAWSDGRSAVVTASLITRTSNTAMLVGTKGSILLHEPFCCPPGLTVRQNESQPTGTYSKIWATPAARQVGRLLRRLRARGKYRPIRKVGHGYRYEAIEVNRCLREGCLESPLMPLDETIAVMEVMDAIHQDFRLH